MNQLDVQRHKEKKQRRRAFYERAGYKACGAEHIHPPYHENADGHRLVVMSYPKQLSEAEYNEFNRYLKAVVMNTGF